ncbi:MAG: hypothetical protein DRI74_08975 [Bacteroidetes bacterium]|nr:MAG: hypothetical protein DRI74_08975 [Bacteroidota bacterium]
MNKRTNILHITDFHLNNFGNDSSEYLREDYYENYLRQLCVLISKKIGVIDAIVITGDFVDKGKTENFPHVIEIIKKLTLILNIDDSNVGVCPGNHDFKILEEEGGKIVKESMDDYKSFEMHYSKGGDLVYCTNDRFYITKLRKDVYFLSLNSCLNRKDNKPSKLTNKESNEIIASLKNISDNPETLLIIGSHYPLSYFDSAPYPDIDGWYDHHIWRSGLILKERIKVSLRQCKILWLCGDTHLPGESIYNNQLFIMSGRLGEKTRFISREQIINQFEDQGHISLDDISETVDKITEEMNQEHRQARVISYDVNGQPEVYTVEHSSRTYTDHSQYGYWRMHYPDRFSHPTKVAELIPKATMDLIEDLDVNGELEDLIIDEIKNNNLYQFNRYYLGDGKVSLGWISINVLLSSNNNLLQLIIISISEWIKSKLEDVEYQDSILIGIDIWGAVIASNISLLLDLPNYSKAANDNTDSYIDQELFTHANRTYNYFDKKNIIYITGIISSGSSLSTLHNLLYELYDKKDKTIEKEIGISILNDNNQIKNNLDFLTSFGTCCTKVKIPIIDEDVLPSEDIIGEDI